MGALVIVGILVAMAITLLILLADRPICQYCNNDGDPCPRCNP